MTRAKIISLYTAAMLCVGNVEGVDSEYRAHPSLGNAGTRNEYRRSPALQIKFFDSKRPMSQSRSWDDSQSRTQKRNRRERYTSCQELPSSTTQWREGTFISQRSTVQSSSPSTKPQSKIENRFTPTALTKEEISAFMAYDDFYSWNPLRNFDPLMDVYVPIYLENLKRLQDQIIAQTMQIQEIGDALQNMADDPVDMPDITKATEKVYLSQAETDKQISELHELISVLKNYTSTKQLQDELTKSLTLFTYPELLVSHSEEIDVKEWKEKLLRIYARLVTATRRFEQLQSIELLEKQIIEQQKNVRGTIEKLNLQIWRLQKNLTAPQEEKPSSDTTEEDTTADKFPPILSFYIDNPTISLAGKGVMLYMHQLQDNNIKKQRLLSYVIALSIARLQEDLEQQKKQESSLSKGGGSDIQIIQLTIKSPRSQQPAPVELAQNKQLMQRLWKQLQETEKGKEIVRVWKQISKLENIIKALRKLETAFTQP